MKLIALILFPVLAFGQTINASPPYIAPVVTTPEALAVVDSGKLATATGSTASWPIAMPAATKGMVLASITYYHGGDVPDSATSVQLGQVSGGRVSMTKILRQPAFSDGDNGAVEMWYKTAPTTGTDTVLVTMTASMDEITGIAFALKGVNQSTPIGTPVGAIGEGTAPSVAVSSATGELVIDAMVSYGQTYTVGAGQTRLAYQENAGDLSDISCSSEPGVASVTMSWTIAVSNYYGILAVPVKP
jgi:hypothetical protein